MVTCTSFFLSQQDMPREFCAPRHCLELTNLEKRKTPSQRTRPMIPPKRSAMILAADAEQRPMIESPTLDATGTTTEEAATPLRLLLIDALAKNKVLQQAVLEQQLSPNPAPSSDVSPSRTVTEKCVPQEQCSLSGEQRARESTLEQQRRIDAAIVLQSLDKLIARDASRDVGELHGDYAAARQAFVIQNAIEEDEVEKSAHTRANMLSEIEANLERCRTQRWLLEHQQLVGGFPVTPECERTSQTTTQYQTPFPPRSPAYRYHPFPSVQPTMHPRQATVVGNRFYSAAPMPPMIHGQFSEEQHHFFPGSSDQQSHYRAPHRYHTQNPSPFVPNMAAAATPRFGQLASPNQHWDFRDQGQNEKDLLEQHLRLNRQLLRQEQKTKTHKADNNRSKYPIQL